MAGKATPSGEKKTRTPRAITIATKKATERVLAENSGQLHDYIEEEMTNAGYARVVVEKWAPAVVNGAAPTGE
jgi:ribosomal protein S3